jgi:hypothetical protein
MKESGGAVPVDERDVPDPPGEEVPRHGAAQRAGPQQEAARALEARQVQRGQQPPAHELQVEVHRRRRQLDGVQARAQGGHARTQLAAGGALPPHGSRAGRTRSTPRCSTPTTQQWRASGQEENRLVGGLQGWARAPSCCSPSGGHEASRVPSHLLKRAARGAVGQASHGQGMDLSASRDPSPGASQWAAGASLMPQWAHADLAGRAGGRWQRGSGPSQGGRGSP